jgi:hypothetical protein
VVKFRAGDLEFNATVAESSESPSPRSGDLLRAMTIQFRAQKVGMHEAAVAEALQRQSGGLYSLGEADQPELEWRVRESNWTYVGSEPWGVNHHIWRIEQVERLACQLLRLGGIELEPYDYVEEASDDGVVRLAARALISAADLQTLSAISGPVEVTRVGISNTPRQMRLAAYVWGERPEGLAVVLACGDVRESRVTVTGFEGSSPDDLEDLVELAVVNQVELRAARHARRRVTNPDAWPLAPQSDG